MQSHIQSNLSFYQNQAKNLQNLTNLQLDDLYSSVYTLIGEAIENDDLESHDNILPMLRAIKKEIQDRNEVTTQDKSYIETINTQINRTIKKRKRNTTTFEYALFLHTSQKITTEKFLLISNKKRAKTDILRRVHTLLVDEHNRLNKVS